MQYNKKLEGYFPVSLLSFSRTPTSKFKTYALEQEVGGRLSGTGCNCFDDALPLGLDCRNKVLTEWECD